MVAVFHNLNMPRGRRSLTTASVANGIFGNQWCLKKRYILIFAVKMILNRPAYSIYFLITFLFKYRRALFKRALYSLPVCFFYRLDCLPRPDLSTCVFSRCCTCVFACPLHLWCMPVCPSVLCQFVVPVDVPPGGVLLLNVLHVYYLHYP